MFDGMGLVEEKRGSEETKNPITDRIESSEGLWWRIRIRLNDSYFPGWVGWALRKVGIIKKNEYDPNDALDITTTYDADGNPTTTIRPKEE